MSSVPNIWTYYIFESAWEHGSRLYNWTTHTMLQ